MLFPAKDLVRFSIEATDGDIGKVDDLFFEEDNWTVRYMVVNTNPWLPGGKVLISPISIESVDLSEGVVRVDLTKDQIKDAPDIDSSEAISRQKEEEYHQYYGFSYYWPFAGYWGHHAYARDLASLGSDDLANKVKEQDTEENEQEGPKLRSAKELTGDWTGYNIVAYEEAAGNVSNLLIEDKTWKVRYMVVSSSKMFSSKEVLLSTDWVNEVDWVNGDIHMNVNKEEIEQAPDYETGNPVERSFEEDLYSHFKKENYWDREL
ncbi:PRC-barrel domain-containing protein [Thalassobacillus sp. C254]|uniref:PRC-barrel domain-containing protein n=1 Tax=Thalassobacillus sp. C254 TaxID=1225341 RepID=UPI0006D04565|nr:PRC-barrel domain-containing protein [Thalassobacillus sp. C254]